MFCLSKYGTIDDSMAGLSRPRSSHGGKGQPSKRIRMTVPMLNNAYEAPSVQSVTANLMPEDEDEDAQLMLSASVGRIRYT